MWRKCGGYGAIRIPSPRWLEHWASPNIIPWELEQFDTRPVCPPKFHLLWKTGEKQNILKSTCSDKKKGMKARTY